LKLVEDNKVKLVGRRDMKDMMAETPWMIAMCHQVNNDYNYMTMEFMYTGFPLIHNAGAWSEYGYYYPDNHIDAAAEQIKYVLDSHSERIELYKSHGRVLAWKHSLYNPDVQAAWKALLEAP